MKQAPHLKYETLSIWNALPRAVDYWPSAPTSGSPLPGTSSYMYYKIDGKITVLSNATARHGIERDIK